MSFRMLCFLVEGFCETTFFEQIIQPILESKGYYVDVYEYSRKKWSKRIGYVKSMNSTGAFCFYLADIDNAKCVSQKRIKLQKKLRSEKEPCNIIIVVQEVEGWLCAGIDSDTLRAIGAESSYVNPNTITKEQFINLIPRRMSHLDFVLRILNEFNITLARTRNESFDYFCEKIFTENLPHPQ